MVFIEIMTVAFWIFAACVEHCSWRGGQYWFFVAFLDKPASEYSLFDTFYTRPRSRSSYFHLPLVVALVSPSNVRVLFSFILYVFQTLMLMMYMFRCPEFSTLLYFESCSAITLVCTFWHTLNEVAPSMKLIKNLSNFLFLFLVITVLPFDSF